jgi:hypothetical protein
VCDPCFDERRKAILSISSKEESQRGGAVVSGNAGVFGFSGPTGFSGYMGFTSYYPQGMGANYTPYPPVEPREEQPPVAYYVYSERADKIEKDIEEKRRSRKRLKRMIRFTEGEEGEDTEEGYSKRMIRIAGEEDIERCPTEEDIINFKKSFTAQIELINKKIIVNPEKPTEGERDLFQHIKVCEKCGKLWNKTP